MAARHSVQKLDQTALASLNPSSSTMNQIDTSACGASKYTHCLNTSAGAFIDYFMSSFGKLVKPYV